MQGPILTQISRAASHQSHGSSFPLSRGTGDDGGTKVAPWLGIPSAIQSLPAFTLQLMAQDYHLQPEDWKWRMAFLTALVWELFRMGFYEGMLVRGLYSQNHEYDSR